MYIKFKIQMKGKFDLFAKLLYSRLDCDRIHDIEFIVDQINI